MTDGVIAMVSGRVQGVYDAAYYASHCGHISYDRPEAHRQAFFGTIADELIRSFQPRRAFDAGCAHGFLVEAFWDRGVEASGRDISEFAISQVRPDIRGYCTVGTIAAPIARRFDLITCIEVVEHMPEAEAIEAIGRMAAATDRIVFSSSPQDFDEPTHINLKPSIYWLRQFAKIGFVPRGTFNALFISPQAIVLERVESEARETDLLIGAELARQRLLRAEQAQTIRDLHEQTAGLRARCDESQAECDKSDSFNSTSRERIAVLTGGSREPGRGNPRPVQEERRTDCKGDCGRSRYLRT